MNERSAIKRRVFERRGEKRRSQRQEEVEGGGREVSEGVLGFVESGDADLRVNTKHEHFDLHVFQGSQDNIEEEQKSQNDCQPELYWIWYENVLIRRNVRPQPGRG